MMAKGSWWLESKTDPRWNCNGEGTVGMFTIPTAAEQKIKDLEKELGEKPDDLKYGYMKR